MAGAAAEAYLRVLADTFRLPGFRPQQLKAITSILGGTDTLVIFPTGAGKSLIYQFAAVFARKLGIVVTPLLALMDDQVSKMRLLGISAFTISSSDSMNSQVQAFTRLTTDPKSITLLYITPETVAKSKFQEVLRSLYANDVLGFFAIDESHVLTDWGNSFRKSYRNLGTLRGLCPSTPILALTATATLSTAEDILSCLQMREEHNVIVQSFNRKNIYYSVWYRQKGEQRVTYLLSYLRRFLAEQTRRAAREEESTEQSTAMLGSSGPRSDGQGFGVIVYCQRKSETEALAATLQQEGFPARYFHAGLDPEIKRSLLHEWINDKEHVQIVVSTIAFGMGIDRSNVRLVVHYNVPKSTEAFYQESGRAGRDGKPSTSLVLVDMEDVLDTKGKVSRDSDTHEKQSFMYFLFFCFVRSCRRKMLLDYFNSGVETKGKQSHGTPRSTLGGSALQGGSRCCDVCDGTVQILNDQFKSYQSQFVNSVESNLRGTRRKPLISLAADHSRDDGKPPPKDPEDKEKFTAIINNPIGLSTDPDDDNLVTEPQVKEAGERCKYCVRLKNIIRKKLIHISAETLEEEFAELERIISRAADNNAEQVNSCFKSLCQAVKAEPYSYVSKGFVHSKIAMFFSLL